jgi:hypothetical protein
VNVDEPERDGCGRCPKSAARTLRSTPSHLSAKTSCPSSVLAGRWRGVSRCHAESSAGWWRVAVAARRPGTGTASSKRSMSAA